MTEEGCAPLDGPLAAFNWFSFADPESYLAYGTGIAPILASRGTQILAVGGHAETLEAPPGVPATGGAYVHEELAVPLYASAEAFIDMLASEEFQAILPLQQAGARQTDYVFGFQQCLVGCDSTVSAVATEDQPLLLHIFDWKGGDLAGAIRDLGTSGAGPEMVYAGRLVGRFRIFFGDTNVNSQSPPWGEGTIVYRVPSAEAARTWITDPAFRAFRGDTAEDVLVLLGAGRLGGDS